MRSAFLGGDYASQFYPWSSIYADAIKNFKFPYWTRYFQSGFPLIAEGQVGAFYPLNLLFFFFLPFKVAYNYLVVLHFALAGIFTYLYARKLGACEWGGSIAALIFCFGSAYAGCFYNTVTVKTLIWVPLVLFFLENYFSSKKQGYVWASGAVLGMQLVAGFAQVACYSAVFYIVYFLYGLKSRKDLRIKDVMLFGAAFALAGIMFLPQLYLSWKLAAVSVRAKATLEFALWGSFPPVNFMSVVFPYWISHGTRFYAGIISLIFIAAYFMRLKADKSLRPLFILFLLSILLALGKYNPLFVLALKLTNFYSFRNPSKILFFAMFASAVMAGVGFTAFARDDLKELRKRSLRAAGIFLAVMGGLFLLSKTILIVFGNKIIELGRWYAANHIFGKSHHRYSMDHYMAKVENIYRAYLQRSSLSEPLLLMSFILIVTVILLWRYYMKRETVGSLHKVVFVSIIFLDLYAFSFYGAGWGGAREFGILEPEVPKLYQVVNSDKEMFRILPYGLAFGGIPNWAMPNLNAVYEIDSAAVYTPLASDKYKERLEGLEIVDESLGLLDPDPEKLKSYKDIIKALNIKYIVSSKQLSEDFIDLAAEEAGVYLYEVKGFLPRTYVSDDLKGTNIEKLSSFKHYSQGRAIISATMKKEGYLVFAESSYTGWTVLVDGVPSEIESFMGVLNAVKLAEGEHLVEFEYHPFGGDK